MVVVQEGDVRVVGATGAAVAVVDDGGVDNGGEECETVLFVWAISWMELDGLKEKKRKLTVTQQPAQHRSAVPSPRPRPRS